MALPPLAATADLTARKIDTTDPTLVAQALAAASAAVRRAAASPILQTTSTVELDGWRDDKWLQLPGPPIVSVTTAAIDGTPVTDYRLARPRMWRAGGWGVDDGPATVAVTLTHGLVEVPADIVDLVCSMVGAGIAAAAEGYQAHGGVIAERIDDYSVQYAQGAEAVASVMELPRRTRAWLRQAFGGGVGMVKFR